MSLTKKNRHWGIMKSQKVQEQRANKKPKTRSEEGSPYKESSGHTFDLHPSLIPLNLPHHQFFTMFYIRSLAVARFN